MELSLAPWYFSDGHPAAPIQLCIAVVTEHSTPMHCLWFSNYTHSFEQFSLPGGDTWLSVVLHECLSSILCLGFSKRAAQSTWWVLIQLMGCLKQSWSAAYGVSQLPVLVITNANSLHISMKHKKPHLMRVALMQAVSYPLGEIYSFYSAGYARVNVLLSSCGSNIAHVSKKMKRAVYSSWVTCGA